MRLSNVVSLFYSSIWAVDIAFHSMIEEILLDHVAGPVSEETIEARLADVTYGRQKAGSTDSIAVIPLHGVILNRAGGFDRMSGYTNPQQFAANVRAAAADPAIKKIVLDIDTPGGTVAGTGYAAEAVKYAASKKETIAVANGMAYSAGYWIASQATKIVAGEGDGVGSIGVIATHRDLTVMESMAGQKTTYIRSSKDKALGQPFEPLSDEIRESIQAEVDKYVDVFRSAVSEGRGVSVDKIKNEWSAKCFIGTDALEAGLIDEIGSLDSVIASLSEGSTMSKTVTATTTAEENTDADVRTGGGSAADNSTLDTDPGASDAAEDVATLQAELAQAHGERDAALADAATAKESITETERENLTLAIETMITDALDEGRILPSQAGDIRDSVDDKSEYDFVSKFLGKIPKGFVSLTDRVETPNGDRDGTRGKEDVAAKFLRERTEADAKFDNPLITG